MAVIYLVRHGQTTFNAAGRLQGQLDSPLTDLGREQAQRVGRKLARLTDGQKARLISSPLGRAHDTARLIASCLGGVEVTLDPRLMEIGMGVWDGMTDFEIEAEFPGVRDGLPEGDWFFHSPDGESLAVFAARLQSALIDIGADADRPAIIVSHGVAGRVIRALHAGLPPAHALVLKVPQDAISALWPQGRIDLIAAD